MNSKLPINSSRPTGRIGLVAAGVAAILASTCCLGPLLLLMLGISGAWISSLTLLEPYRPFFIGISLIALVASWQRVWRPAADCSPGEFCDRPQVKWSYRVLYITVVVLLLIAVSFPWIAPWFY
ncbi:mercuric ion transporter MerT [Pseudoduganella sp. OTU4001]|uniref:mercuric ion transporter MerT n=1 Tax=Pseudoduganella sp. OTU4001 TaxID=3043854 RepID=UPI00313BCD45